MTTFDLFTTAERIELITAAIYAAVAKQFVADEAARALFAHLEQEELQHAARVRLLAKRRRADRHILPTIPGPGELDSCLAHAEATLANVLAGTWDGDLAATKRELIRLEGVMSRSHAHVMAKDGDPALRDFFRQLAMQDDAHLALLGAK